jgi:hypothetical protein
MFIAVCSKAETCVFHLCYERQSGQAGRAKVYLTVWQFVERGKGGILVQGCWLKRFEGGGGLRSARGLVLCWLGCERARE